MITSSISAISDDSGTVASVTIAGTREGVDGFVELLGRVGLRVLKRVDVHDALPRPTSPPAPAEAASGPHGAGTGPSGAGLPWSTVPIEWVGPASGLLTRTVNGQPEEGGDA